MIKKFHGPIPSLSTLQPVRFAIVILLGFLLLTGCKPSTVSQPINITINPALIQTYAADHNLAFQFPLKDYDPRTDAGNTSFGMTGTYAPYFIQKHHAAEDCYRPAGTPVYAMANGHVSYSGPASGYGWLIIIDHPQINLYSLYGHISPSHWRITTGTVSKGGLIGYLGDSNENGSKPPGILPPHLHFGVRTGQRADYPSKGEWRWQAGWVKSRPQDLGWLQPSAIIISQHIPAGGYRFPSKKFQDYLTFELLASVTCSLCCVGMLIMILKKKRVFFLIFLGLALVAAGSIWQHNLLLSIYVLPAIGTVFLIFGLLFLTHHRKQ